MAVRCLMYCYRIHNITVIARLVRNCALGRAIQYSRDRRA